MRRMILVIEQLIEAKKLIQKNTDATLRMSLILLDNVAEILMYRKIKEELSTNNFYLELLSRYEGTSFLSDEANKLRDNLVQEIIPNKRLKALNRYYSEKVDFLVEKGIISKQIAQILNSIHDYRNEAYHNETMHTNSIRPVLMLMFEIVCNMFIILDDCTRYYRSDEETKNNEFLQSIGFKRISFVERADLVEVTSALQKDFTISLDDLRHELTLYLQARLNKSYIDIKFVSKHIRESKKNLLKFAQQLATFNSEIRKFNTMQTKFELFIFFVNLEKRYEPISEEIAEIAMEFDKYIQQQIDIARGK